MIEKIPVGGWRNAEQREVLVVYGKAKARDVVPGWPRGRSTSRSWPSEIPIFGIIRWGDELYLLEERRLEERRKALMMERYYQEQRPELPGSTSRKSKTFKSKTKLPDGISAGDLLIKVPGMDWYAIYSQDEVLIRGCVQEEQVIQ